jgi:hypothetical protein
VRAWIVDNADALVGTSLLRQQVERAAPLQLVAAPRSVAQPAGAQPPSKNTAIMAAIRASSPARWASPTQGMSPPDRLA